MTLIDTHSHIYLKEFDHDLIELMARAEQQGVQQILLPAINKEHLEKQMSITAQYSNCRSMMGLHPCYVTDHYQLEMELVYNTLKKSPSTFVGVGEIGLDYYWDKSRMEQQKHCFETQLDWAIEFDLPVSIHSRDATQDCIEAVQQRIPYGLRGVFHCFSGTLEQAQQIIDCGFYLGIGGVVTFKNSPLISILKTVGLGYIVLETDAPYLAPVPFRGKRNEPAYLKNIVEFLAIHVALSPQTIAQITTENAQKLFRL